MLRLNPGGRRLTVTLERRISNFGEPGKDCKYETMCWSLGDLTREAGWLD
jgi:hypothetical protein